MEAGWFILYKVIYLDRDGVINKKAREHDYIKCWEEFEFLPGALEALKILHESNYKIVLITNQRGIARKIMTVKSLEDIHNKMCQKIAESQGRVDGIYYCPHDYGECNCRKPDIGLFLESEKKYMPDKKKSWMIGDSSSDIKAGKAFGVNTLYIGTDNLYHADYSCDTLLTAAKYITEKGE